MNITLHQAAEDVRALLDQIDPETGEMPEGYEAARDIVERKAVAVVAYVLERERCTEMLAQAQSDLAARIKAEKAKTTYMRQYLSAHMAALGITKITDERGLFSAKLEMGRDEAVEIDDPAAIHTKYTRVVPERREPDKALLRTALKDGTDVFGARLVYRNRLTIK